MWALGHLVTGHAGFSVRAVVAGCQETGVVSLIHQREVRKLSENHWIPSSVRFGGNYTVYLS